MSVNGSVALVNIQSNCPVWTAVTCKAYFTLSRPTIRNVFITGPSEYNATYRPIHFDLTLLVLKSQKVDTIGLVLRLTIVDL